MKTHWLPTADSSPGALAWFRRWGVPEEHLHRDPGRAQFARTIQEPLDVDVVIAEGDVLELGEFRLEVLETPGHCEGHVVFYERETQSLFSGDHLLTDISPVPLLSFPQREGEPRPRSLLRFMDSLAKVERLACRITLPSHGDVIWDHRQVIAGYRLHHERRKLQMLRMLREGPRTPFEIAVRMFRRHWQSQLFLVLSEVIGHLDLLEHEGLVAFEPQRGVDVARIAGRPD
jgi:glyoxylase-like metal-dependent hydrolase (beta-lactamase superfamily II)